MACLRRTGQLGDALAAARDAAAAEVKQAIRWAAHLRQVSEVQLAPSTAVHPMRVDSEDCPLPPIGC